ncbi:DUF2806 domain-containing protein [Methylobacterium sp. Leaf456]|uniref:DUF2806 domain-containing protein n=1 Tax=Methylobacterium sp. Leaf456 TaxID=1736382 RepID=UPI0009EB1E2A|nr:DUF2806 domain-containing protein [Methylobacterium sp. Leaf456]
MADEEQQPEAHEPTESPPSERSIADNLSELATTVATGIPPQAQRNLWKAFGRVVLAGVEWPENYLKGKGQITKAAAGVKVARLEAEASEIRAKQKAREVVLKESAKASLPHLRDPQTSSRALDYHFEEITREQQTREDILRIAARELSEEEITVDASGEIEDDWLFAFFKIAAAKTKEEWKEAFGRVLAGEIKKPGTFSISAVEVFSRLDQATADIFRRACNLSSEVGRGARIVVPEDLSIGENKFAHLGLSYTDIARLVEVGLLRHDLSEYTEFDISKDEFSMQIGHADVSLVIASAELPEGQSVRLPRLRLSGPGFTSVGAELRSIIDMSHSMDYLKALSGYLNKMGLSMLFVVRNEAGGFGLMKIDPVT